MARLVQSQIKAYTNISFWCTHLFLNFDVQVKLSFSNGLKSPTNLVYDVAETFCDDAWHTLSVDKDIKTGTITVDGGDPMSVVGEGQYTAVGATNPLTLGRTSGSYIMLLPAKSSSDTD